MMILMITLHLMILVIMISHMLPAIIHGMSNNDSSQDAISLIHLYDSASSLKDNATHLSTLWSEQSKKKMIQQQQHIEHTIIRSEVIKLHDLDQDVDIDQIPSSNSSSILSSASSSFYDKSLYRSHHRKLLDANHLTSTSRSLLINTVDMNNAMYKSITDSTKAMMTTNLLHFETWSTPHSLSSSSSSSSSSSIAIFTCALSLSYVSNLANFFAGTARKAGFNGDIVVAVLPGTKQGLLDALKIHKVTVYTLKKGCIKRNKVINTVCEYENEELPITLMRMFIYQYWALKYPDTTYIMMSDFRDVMFQTNPFTLKNKFPDWGPSAYDIVFSAEHHPNRVINRNLLLSSSLSNCYGTEVHGQIGPSTIINNGVVFATRNASLIYNYLITEQRKESVRNQLTIDFTSTNKRCYSFGVDLAFHNYLYYSGILHKYFKVKVFPHGEGPINIVGGFYGQNKLLKGSLSDWRILRGEGKFKYVYNWNGEISPVVHQLDRFLSTELADSFKDHLAVFQN